MNHCLARDAASLGIEIVDDSTSFIHCLVGFNSP
jgi:hypothetical protein